MAGGINKVILVGNVGREPEVRTMQNGGKVASFSLATTETWRDRDSGERRDRTEWHRISIFNENLVRVVEDYVRKGQQLYIEGQLQTRKWTDRDGQERYTTEVVLQRFRGELQMLGRRGDALEDRSDFGDPRERQSETGPAAGRAPVRGESSGQSGSRTPAVDDDLDDEVPF